MQCKLHKSLYFQVVVGLLLGIVIGYVDPDLGVKLKFLGDGFINLIKMIITPVIFCTVVVGIASMKSLKAVGRVGAKALIYFEVITTFALTISMVVANFVKPGAGINADPATIDSGSLGSLTQHVTQTHGAINFIMGIIPSSVVDAFAKGNLLQVLLFSVLFGVSLAALGSKGEPVLDFLDRFGKTLLGIVGIIMKLAPIGAFGAIAFTVGKYGIGTLAQLGELVVCYYTTAILFVVIVLGAVCRWYAGISLFRLLVYIKEELFITLGTASTEAVLPRILVKLEAMGCPKAIVGLVVPTGYSFNLDGAAIYLSMATIFIAQAMNIELTIEHQIGLLAIMLMTSKGGAGVAGAVLIALAATLSSTNVIPVAGLALVIGIDRIQNEIRAIVNLIGNCVATVVVSKWEKALDTDTATRVLNGQIDVECILEKEADVVVEQH
ncbi:MAG TPA: C4-dicarboxylate transporter DctA [Solidesulfovibrio sp.]|nr:C4-dicarboxylate transporter DctA [Solidesulfovibrio sp.]